MTSKHNTVYRVTSVEDGKEYHWYHHDLVTITSELNSSFYDHEGTTIAKCSIASEVQMFRWRVESRNDNTSTNYVSGKFSGYLAVYNHIGSYGDMKDVVNSNDSVTATNVETGTIEVYEIDYDIESIRIRLQGEQLTHFTLPWSQFFDV